MGQRGLNPLARFGVSKNYFVKVSLPVTLFWLPFRLLCVPVHFKLALGPTTGSHPMPESKKLRYSSIEPKVSESSVHAALLHAHTTAAALGQPLLTSLGERLLTVIFSASCFRPCWDTVHRQLTFGGRVLKEFRQPACQQTALLDQFQARDWPVESISVSLPGAHGEPNCKPKSQLSTTIKNLNRSLPPDTIHFHGDGTGTGVRWAMQSDHHEENPKTWRIFSETEISIVQLLALIKPHETTSYTRATPLQLVNGEG